MQQEPPLQPRGCDLESHRMYATVGATEQHAHSPTLKFVCPVVTRMGKLDSPPLFVLLDIHNLLLPPLCHSQNSGIQF